jgi:hypothetical protein
MKTLRLERLLQVVSCVLLGMLTAAAATQSGDWTMRRSDEPGKIHFMLSQSREGGTSQHSSDWPLTAFSGLDVSKAGRQEVHFTIARDAGKFACEGVLNNGEGAGIFHFSPSESYAHEMEAMPTNSSAWLPWTLPWPSPKRSKASISKTSTPRS